MEESTKTWYALRGKLISKYSGVEWISFNNPYVQDFLLKKLEADFRQMKDFRKLEDFKSPKQWSYIWGSILETPSKALLKYQFLLPYFIIVKALDLPELLQFIIFAFENIRMLFYLTV